MKGPWGRMQDDTQAGTLAFGRWALFSCVIGVAVGTAGAGFHHAVAFATAARQAHPALLFGLPLAGLLIVWLYRVCDLARDGGTNLVLISVRDNAPIRFRVAPLIVIATTLTHLFGGSSGREGAALQLG